jgi:hypothetical protein
VSKADDMLDRVRGFVELYEASGRKLKLWEVDRFVDAVGVLDQHLSKGGDLPAEWEDE